MSSESHQNPYSIGTSPEPYEFAWTDGDVEFTETEIRVRGDFELPELCIHTGIAEDLIQREQTVRTRSPFANRVAMACSMAAAGPYLLKIFLPFLTGVMPGLSATLSVLDSLVPVILFPTAGCVILLNRFGHKVGITWYLSRSYATPREKMRQIFGVSIVLVAILAMMLIYETASLWWLALVVATALAGVILGRERTIGARSFRDGRFVLKGHSAEFAHAWAAKTAARDDE